jgi:hypothetical protein
LIFLEFIATVSIIKINGSKNLPTEPYSLIYEDIFYCPILMVNLSSPNKGGQDGIYSLDYLRSGSWGNR